MTSAEINETGEYYSMPRIFTSLGGHAVLHGELVSPLSENEGASFLLESIPPLDVSGQKRKVIYVPPYLLDGETYGDMVDVTFSDGVIKKSISLFREPSSTNVTTMVTLSPVAERRQPPREVPANEIMVGHLAIKNLFDGGTYEGEDVRAAEDRVRFLLNFGNVEASPEDVLALDELMRALDSWYQR